MKKPWKWFWLTLAGLVLASPLSFGRSSQSEIDQMVKLYLDALKKAFGPLSPVQTRNATQLIISFMINGDRDFRKLNYILATAWHESRKLTDLTENRCSPGTQCYEDQNRYWNTGYYGRGFVQITHKANYQKLQDRLGIKLVASPDLAVEPANAADIAVVGMMEGLFTGARLDRYISPVAADYFNARRVVTSVARPDLVAVANQIALYATSINSNLEYPLA